MKKTLSFGLASLLALALFFTACSGPLDNITNWDGTRDETILKLDNPVVTAKAFKGVIVVGWNQNLQADNYTVTRKDSVTGEVKQLYSGDTDFFLYDAVSSINSLVDGRDYTYTVTAESLRNPARSILMDPDTDNGEQKPLYYDGVGEATVRANIPAGGTLVDVPSADQITLEQRADGAYIYVTWTDPEVLYNTYVVSVNKALPEGAEDELLVILGDYGNIGTDATGTGIVNPFSDPRKFATLPLIGGELAVKVNGTFRGGTFYRDNYTIKTYPGPAALPKVVPVESPLNAVEVREPNQVILSWKKLDEATGYDVYYAPRDGNNVSGDWQLVELTIEEDPTTTPDTIRGVHTNVDLSNGKTYRYAVIAKNETARSSGVAVFNTGILTASVPPEADLDFDVYSVRDIFTQASSDVYLSFELPSATAYPGVQYRIEKATVESKYAGTSSKPADTAIYGELEDGTLRLKSAWTQVNFTTDSNASTQYIFDTVPLAQEAVYRLVVIDPVSNAANRYTYKYVPKQHSSATTGPLGNAYNFKSAYGEFNASHEALVTLSWDKQLGETYALNVISVDAPRKHATTVSVSETATAGSSKAVYQATLKAHQRYIFKVTVTASDGYTKTYFSDYSEAISGLGVFRNLIQDDFAKSGVARNPDTGNDIHYTASLGIGDNEDPDSLSGIGYTGDITVELWRQEISGAGGAPISGSTKISGSTRLPYFSTYDDSFTAADVGKFFRYYTDFYLNDVKIASSISSTATEYEFKVIEPSFDTSYWTEGNGTSGTASYFYATNSTAQPNNYGFINAQVVVQVQDTVTLEYVDTTTTATVQRTNGPTTGFLTDLGISNAYYFYFTAVQLNSLNTTTTPRTYRIVYKPADAEASVQVPSGFGFTVTSSTVTGW